MSDNIMPVYHNFLFQVQKAVHPYKFRLSSRHLPSFLCTLGKKIPRVHFSRSVCTLIAIISHFVLFFNLFYVISLCFYAITTKIPFFYSPKNILSDHSLFSVCLNLYVSYSDSGLFLPAKQGKPLLSFHPDLLHAYQLR